MGITRAGRRVPLLIAAGLLGLVLAGCGGGGNEASAKTKAPQGSTLDLQAGPVRAPVEGEPGTWSAPNRSQGLEARPWSDSAVQA